MKRVLHAHPDRWTVGLDRHLPPEERTRLTEALIAAALALVGDGAAIEESEGFVQDDEEQRAALARWRAASSTREQLASALDAVLCGALWESPAFSAGPVTVRFHPGFRLLVDGAGDDALRALASGHGLIVRDR